MMTEILASVIVVLLIAAAAAAYRFGRALSEDLTAIAAQVRNVNEGLIPTAASVRLLASQLETIVEALPKKGKPGRKPSTSTGARRGRPPKSAQAPAPVLSGAPTPAADTSTLPLQLVAANSESTEA